MVGLGAFTAMVLGSIPGWGTNIPQAVWHGWKRVLKCVCLLNHLGNLGKDRKVSSYFYCFSKLSSVL